MEHKILPKTRNTPLHLQVMAGIVAALAVFVIVLLCIRPASLDQQTEIPADQDPAAVESPQADGAVSISDAQASGAFAYAINPVMTLQDGMLDLEIMNLSAGEYALQINVTISGGEYDGQAVYKTGLILPGHGVDAGEILEALPEGLYGALTEIRAIDMDREQSIGSVPASVVICVPATTPAPSPTPHATPTPEPAAEPQDTVTAEPDEPAVAESSPTPTTAETEELSVSQLEEILGLLPHPAEDGS